MSMINDTQREQIRQAIVGVEKHTSGELVTVIARQSDAYTYIPLLWAALVSLVTPGLILAIIPILGLWIEIDIYYIYFVQILVFVLLGFLLQWNPVKMRLVPKTVKQRRASRLAHEQFYRQGLHNTEKRTGVLIFVSEAEHFVEIIADSGINEKVEKDAWEKAVADFVSSIRAGQTADGFIAAINDCGDLLKQYFPPDNNKNDELTNHLIEI